MILRELTLENIRSYRDETRVAISAGTTLFEGDIASGKSTLLYAIEFALFGLGSLKGSFLLRNGAKQGHVSLAFTVDGRDYEVHRTLVKKGKSIQQEECYIQGPEGKALLSPTEVKERILQILKFNEPPNPKAQSVIYRYAIFTPQEEMKEVILKDPDDRLQTLRRAFRIEDYKIAIENSSVLISRIKGRISYLEGATADLPSAKTRLEEATKTVQKFKEQLEPLKQTEKELKEEYDKKNGELKALENERERIGKAIERIPFLTRQIGEKNRIREKLAGDNEKAQRKISDELQPKMAELARLKKPTGKTKQQLKQEVTKLRAESRDAERQRAKLDERAGNFESILTKKVCPICERPIDPKKFREKAQHLKRERSGLDEAIKKADKQVQEKEELIDKLEKYEEAQKETKGLRSQLEEANNRIAENDRTVVELEKDSKDLETQLASAEQEAKPLEKVLQGIEGLEKRVKELYDQLTDVMRKIATKEEGIRSAEESLRELQQEIGLKEKQVKVKDSLSEQKIWLSDYFAPTLENIEKHVMASLNQSFNEQFQRWFRILIEDPELQVRVDENFSPVMEREGYEQEFQSLSGGEKTSVALAYRLALNTIVQEVVVGTGSNLLILDEPTDGFSKEQLSRMRDILRELKCPQVILVSHEKELEGFADRVIKVEKREGISHIA
jgi:exonuclease SbcC